MSLHDMLGFGSVPDHNGVGVTIDDLGIVLIPISNCIIRLHLSYFDNFARTKIPGGFVIPGSWSPQSSFGRTLLSTVRSQDRAVYPPEE